MREGAAYIRVSTDKQDEYSPDAQKRLIFEYAEKNNIHIDSENVFMEIGISGRKADKRPEFQKMIAKCKEKSHPIDVILVWKFSRFARNQEESIVYKNLLRKSNVDVHSISEPIPEGFIGELIKRIFEWMDEYYSINLSGEVIRGMTQKVMSGGYVSKSPYGYNHVKKGIPTINKEQSIIVQNIYKWFVNDNMGITTIAKKLNNLGIKTNTGNLWSHKTIKYILQNPFYIGKIRWNYQPTDSTGRHINDDYMLVDGAHKPIIEESLFNESQNRLSVLAGNSTSKRVYTETRKHWLVGILKCATCGGSMGYASKGKNRTPYFRCIRYGRGQCTCSNGIIIPKLEKEIIKGMRLAVANNSYHIVEEGPDTTELESIQDSIKMLSVKEERIRLAYINGIDTLEDYQRNKNLVQKESSQLQERLEELKNEYAASQSSLNLDDAIISVANILENDNVSIQDKTFAIKSICSKIIYDKSNNTLEFYFKK